MRSRKSYVALLLLLFFISGVLRNIRNPLIIQADDTEQVAPDDDDTKAPNQEGSSNPEVSETPSSEPNSDEAAPSQNETGSSESESTPSDGESTPAEDATDSSESESDQEEAPDEEESELEMSDELMGDPLRAPNSGDIKYKSQFSLNDDPQNAINPEASQFTTSFELTRPYPQNHDAIIDAYDQGWWVSNSPIHDHKTWTLKSFDVNFVLHVAGQQETWTDKMSMVVQQDAEPWNKYRWYGTTSFNSVPTPNGNIVVEYYTNDDGSNVEAYLLQYDLFLRMRGDEVVLSIPRLENTVIAHLAGDTSYKTILTVDFKDDLYLDGRQGSDSNDGLSPAAPVQTLAKVQEILQLTPQITKVHIGDTVELVGPLNCPNVTFLRASDFGGYLFSVPSGQQATLSNVVIDGNSEANSEIEKSLVEVRSGATLNISEGAILRNNKIKAIRNTATQGGGVYASSATVNMNGGVVEENQGTYGGGIYLYKSTMNFTGGTVQNNRSNLVSDWSVTPTQYYSAGGGIVAAGGSTINLSGNAKVLGNYAKEIGGGISLGTNQWGPTNTLNMDGGIVSGNTAGSSGGGIFVQAKYFSGGASKARISGGKITSNVMDGSGVTEKEFGGGGIYVNGAKPDAPYHGGNGELYLYNAVVTHNAAQIDGAGYAACPISKTKIYVTNGSAIYGNTVAGGSKDLYILCNYFLGLHGGAPEYNLSHRMLGGVPYNWKHPDGSLLEDERYTGTLTQNNEALALFTTESGNALTAALMAVDISGNYSATRGGGIGSNGTVVIGEDKPVTEVSVSKVWDDNENADGNRPESIVVKLMATIDGETYVVESRTLSQENDWKTTFAELPTKHGELDIVYSVEEEKVEGYTGEISGNAIDGFVITNRPGPTETTPTATTTTTTPETTRPLFTEIRVIKSWDDNDNQDGMRPGSVTFKLLADGEDAGKRLTISAADYWKGYFTDLPTYDGDHRIVYTIEEVDVPEGYQSQISGNSWEGFYVANARLDKTVDVEGHKTWNDNGDEAGKRPGTITIRLLKNGVEIDSRTVSEADGWTWSFKDLPQFEDGKRVEYSIVEDEVEGYSSEVSGYDVINHLGTTPTTEPSETTSSTSVPEETTTPTTTTTPTATATEETTMPTTVPPEDATTVPPVPTTSNPGPGVPSTGETMNYAYPVLLLAAAVILLVLRKRAER